MSLGHLETALDFEVRKVSEGSDDSRNCVPPPILLGQGEPVKCQKWPPSSPESATGQPPKCGNEASWAGGQNAQLRGHWAYLEAGGTLENAQAMAAHESPRTTKLYDRTGDEITLDEVERITI